MTGDDVLLRATIDHTVRRHSSTSLTHSLIWLTWLFNRCYASLLAMLLTSAAVTVVTGTSPAGQLYAAERYFLHLSSLRLWGQYRIVIRQQCSQTHHWTFIAYRAQTHASRRLRPVAVSARLAPSHASYRGPELVWATGRLMSPDRSFGTSCLLHCGHLTVSANLEDSWKRICLSMTRLRRPVTLAFRRRI